MSNPSYDKRTPRGWMGDPQRGAAMGRSDKHGDADFAGDIILRPVALVEDDAYDRFGTYWDVGAPLFWYASRDNSIDACIRCATIGDARFRVQFKYPHATIIVETADA